MHSFGKLGLVLALSTTACGSSDKVITVVFDAPALALVDPYAVDARLAKLRVWVKDSGTGSVVRDLGPTDHQVVMEGYRSEETEVTVVAEGYDELGTVVAYGRVEGVPIEEAGTTIHVALRRSIAYVIHSPNPGQNHPESQIYLLDVATKAYLGKVTIPGNAPFARGISARGGESILVAFSEGSEGKVGVLSTSDHSWKIYALPVIQELAVAGPGGPGLVVGGGRVTALDLETGAAEPFKEGGSNLEIGGQVLDAAVGLGGRRAVVAFDANLAVIDLVNRTSRRIALDGPGGVGLSADGLTAFATSRSIPAVAMITLEQQSSQIINSAFEDATGIATYSDAIPGVLAVSSNSTGKPVVLGWEDGGGPIPYEERIEPTSYFASGITSDGPGRRIVLVLSGTSTRSAGLTVIDTFSNGAPSQGSNTLYPSDPDDATGGDPAVLRTRYRPSGVAVVYGR